MSKKMLINATHPEESRVATVEDGLLTDLDIESEGREMTRGNIYKATVVRVEQGLQAAFIDYGAERLGFLQMGELHPSYFAAFEAGEGKGRPRINDLLRRGQEILVQVVKEERGTKGAALTTYLSLPGRYMVLMPDSDTKGVSRKIEEETQRKKLKEAMKSLDLPPQMGYIVRTAGIGQTKEELKRDFDYLVRVWQNIQELGRRVKAPALVYKESNLVIRSIRDYFTADMDEVLVDDPEVYEEAKEFFQQVMPEYVRLVKLHQERRPIFSRYQIEEQIETLSRNKVPLTSGGSIVIDATEALVAIDVNSGKMAGEQGVEGTAYKTNIEAAAEVGRQLRLRDLGGLIVIDFIDMRDRKHIREVEKVLKDSLKNDKARVTVGKISQFGLLEMSRQRIKATLAEGSYLSCPNCGGSGRVKSAEAQAVGFLRKLHAAIARGQVERVEGEVPIDVAHYLLNTKREELLEMERRYQVSIFIRARKSFVASQFELIVHKREKGEVRDDLYAPVTAASAPHHPIAAPTLAPVAGNLPAVAESPKPAESAAEDLPQPSAPIPAEEELSPDTAAEGDAKRKRKRRRRKKKKGEAGESGEGPEELAATATETEDEPEEEATDLGNVAADSGEEPQKRKRKRRRRKKKTADETTTSVEATGEGTASEPPQVAAPAPAGVTEVPEEPRPVRNRRRKPATEKPATEKPATEKPAARKPAARKPATEKPAAEKPATEKPAAEKPAAEKPAAEKPAAEKPAAKKPAAKKPAARKPAARKPAAEKPATEKPAAEKPEAKRRVARKPAVKTAAAPEPQSAATGAEAGAEKERTPRKRAPRKKPEDLPSK
ncbi:ribonuclease, Rne/Rng family [Desulfuromonas sp. DDH964]|uniref:Rne/Rng family ribonuclease n=1 Tax=Desulfuromonas sp. DDH964 TaxID=1823759 RepID=UPI00078C005B|nr:Rne/Rng family ribonuclease [Desulfuromonas sp. DDH964]AMV72961.1 ribonuclease, Rne/Rng family [Desulfuromonas sp. DDH964]